MSRPATKNEAQQHTSNTQPSPSDEPKATPPLSLTSSEPRKYWLKLVGKTVFVTDEDGNEHASALGGMRIGYRVLATPGYVGVDVLQAEQRAPSLATISEVEAEQGGLSIAPSRMIGNLRGARFELYRAKKELSAVKTAIEETNLDDLSDVAAKAVEKKLNDVKVAFFRAQGKVNKLELENAPQTRATKAIREALRRAYAELDQNGFGGLASHLRESIVARGQSYVYLAAREEAVVVRVR